MKLKLSNFTLISLINLFWNYWQKGEKIEEDIEDKNTLDISNKCQEKDNKDSDQIIDNTAITDDTVLLINETILDLDEVIQTNILIQLLQFHLKYYVQNLLIF